MIQEVSGVYTSPFSDTDVLKMALRARKVSGDFEKRAPGQATSLFQSITQKSIQKTIFSTEANHPGGNNEPKRTKMA